MSPTAPSAAPDGAHDQPVVRAAGDSALLLEFGDRLDPAINDAVIAFDAHLRQAAIPGVAETAPTIRSVLVRYDPLEIAPDTLRGRLRELLAERDWFRAEPPGGRTLWRIPACYGGAFGPELDEIADLVGCSAEEAVERHAATRQRVFMLGFAPGVAYLGLLPEAWDLPRLTEIKPEVPAGSILVAVRQTVLFATTMPTGWRVVARTPFRSFDPGREPPVLLSPGDEVVFDPVPERDMAGLEDKVARGERIVGAEEIA